MSGTRTGQAAETTVSIPKVNIGLGCQPETLSLMLCRFGNLYFLVHHKWPRRCDSPVAVPPLEGSFGLENGRFLGAGEYLRSWLRLG